MTETSLGSRLVRKYLKQAALPMLLLCGLALAPLHAIAQVDQGTITGAVTDPTGAIIPSAAVTLTDTDTGLVLTGSTNKSGVYVFSPIKIGTYSVKAEAKGFAAAEISGLTLNVDQRLQANLKVQPGSVSQTVTVSSTGERLLETESSSVGQVVSSKVINDTPLNGRNYLFVAQLTAGVVESSGSRGQGNGDFSANGERAEQNNFILDGVDNNSNAVDFLNGASYVVKPPPDALAEFKVQTSSFSAQFGHSAGAVINASIKSGTNNLHGDVWEYFRNDALDAIDYFAKSKPEFRQNQFGGTIGGPILPNKLFFFGDVEADRLVVGNVYTQAVPTALERQGNFTELLNTRLTGASQPVMLYQPGSNGSALLACNGQQNVFCPNQINPIAQRVLNLYPQPNANNGLLYNNYVFNQHQTSNTAQWDGRIDWNPSDKDQSFFRMSYYNTRGNDGPPLGFVLDGGYYGGTGNVISLGENFALSETHEFSPAFSNEIRFGYNFGHFENVQSNANTDVAGQLGYGGIPYVPGNGGLPATGIEGYGGVSFPGTPNYYPSNEYENVFEILDNVTKVVGNNTLKAGVSFQHVRFSTLQPPFGHGQAIYNGFYTSSPRQNFTGSGTADFLADEQASGALSPFFTVSDARWYSAAYFQDDWKALPKLTLNLGLRYDFYQPTEDRHDNQALFTPTTLAPGAGTGVFLLPRSKQADTGLLAPAFLTLAAKDNLSIQYTSNRSLQTSQYTDFGPRIGFAYQPTERSVIRGGFGIFFGGLESVGAAPNLSQNYPFAYTSQFTNPGCPTPTFCATDGISLNTGFQQALAVGLNNFVQTPGLEGANPHFYSPYAEQFNLSTQYAFTHTMSLTAWYVGNVSRHLQNFPDQNAAFGLIAPGLNAQLIRPFPEFGGSQYDAYSGVGSYNSAQVTLEKRTSGGLYFLTTYTYGHALDSAATPLTGGAGIYRSPLIIPPNMEYASSDWDVRQRYTFNGDYELPFGKGRKYLNRGGVLNEVAGQWSADLVFEAQTGNPVTVGASNSNGPNGGGARRAFRTGDPFRAGEAAGCPTRVRTLAHWFNPCSFTDPLSGNQITNGVNNPIRDLGTVLSYLGPARNQTYGPGYERINLSAFKNFDTIENQYLQFRADIFNLFNTPAFGGPNGSDGPTGGQITGTRSLGAFTPNPRFVQFALKYYF